MKLNTILYENPQTHYLMQERGIKRPNEKIEDVFRRIIVSLVHEDLQLDKTNTIDTCFLEPLLFFTNKKTIIYGTPILTNVGREEDLTAGACTVLSPTDEHGEIDFERFAKASRCALHKGIGTGYDLSRTHFPLKLLRRISRYLYETDQELRQKNKRPSASMITLEATVTEPGFWQRKNGKNSIITFKNGECVMLLLPFFLPPEQAAKSPISPPVLNPIFR